MIFHDSITKIICLKHQNKAEFKNLDDSEIPSCDFPGLRTSAASMTSPASFHQKKLLILIVGSFLAPK
jgi:hypothetical protein